MSEQNKMLTRRLLSLTKITNDYKEFDILKVFHFTGESVKNITCIK